MMMMMMSGISSLNKRKSRSGHRSVRILLPDNVVLSDRGSLAMIVSVGSAVGSYNCYRVESSR